MVIESSGSSLSRARAPVVDTHYSNTRRDYGEALDERHMKSIPIIS